MEIEKYIAIVKLYNKRRFSKKAMYVIPILYSKDAFNDNYLIEKALVKAQLFGEDLSDFETKITRKKIVEINTDLLPTENGSIPDPHGSELRKLQKYILENRADLLGNNYIELFYNSKLKKINIEKMSSPNLESKFLDNLSEEYKDLFYN